MRPVVLMLFCSLVACDDRQDRSGSSPASEDSADHAFAGVQRRGRAAMGVDQYTSHHRFEPLPDGGRITLERNPSDRAGVRQIQTHMHEIAASFKAGDFTVPGFVHAGEVPGAGVMRLLRARIKYIPQPTPAGGQLRIISPDSQAVAAIHEFLAFQRRDHRVEPQVAH